MKFSIVVPVYNVAPYLRGCLDSVCNQTFSDWECVCVDDGSTDGSAEILDAYQRNERNRFRVIHQKNAGVGAARNAALDVATGEHVVFVDGDDGLVPNALEILDCQIAATNADVIQYGHTSVKSLAEPVQEVTVTQIRTFDLEKLNDARQAYRQVAGSLIAWNGCYRREIIRDVRFLPIPNGEDVVWGVECFFKAKRIAVCDARLYRYVNRAGSAARAMSVRHVLSSLRAIEEVATRTREWKFGENARDILMRKNRAGIMGGVVPQVIQLKGEDRQVAERAFYECLSRVAWNSASRIVARTRSFWLLTCMLRIPFAFRAKMARIRNMLSRVG